MRKLLFLAIGLLMLTAAAFAQQVVKGKITSEDGTPIAGATIFIKGTKKGTSANEEGVFSLTLPANARFIVVSAVGYGTKEVEAGSAGVLQVKLGADATTMSEVVVVAYGTQKKESLTGSYAVVSAKDIEKRPLTNPVAALEGAAAGIQVNNTVGQPGASPTVRIRGFTSVNGDNDPLYVIDGVPFGGNVADINPADIESISVLKDAASTALYGARASNGVILMTTKRGSKGLSSVNFTMNQGFYNKGIQEYNKMNANEFMETMWKGYRNYLMSSNPTTYPTAALAGAKASSTLISDYLKLNIYNKADDALFDANGKLVADATILPGYASDLDWYKDYERTGRRQEYNLSGRSGSDKNSLYFSVGYLDEKGYVNYSDFKRFVGRINADLQATPWFKYGFNLGATHQTSNNTPSTSGNSTAYVNPIYFSRTIAPIYPVHLHDAATGAYVLDESGNKQYDDGTNTRAQYVGRHAIWENELNKDQNYRNTLNGQVYMNVKFLKDFTLAFNGDMNARNNDEHTYNNAVIGDGAGNSGRASRTNYRYLNYTVRQSLSWAKRFGNHSVDAFAGHENYSNEYNYLYAYKTTESFANATELVNFTNITSLTDYKDVYRTEGYFARGRYSFADKYFAEASFRRDGSSRFAAASRWGNFWSIGGSWTISRENFFQPLAKKVNFLKFRTSYGSVGNDAGAGYYASLALYDLAQNANAAALYKSQNAATNLVWEASGSTTTALEGRVFDRLNFTVEYFNKWSTNLLFDVNLPLSAGATSNSAAEATITENVGSISNRGWEFTVDADLFRTKDFRINLGANATLMKNEVTKLHEQNKGGIVNGSKRYLEGHSIYDFWLYQFEGVDQMTGNALYTPNTTDFNVNGSAPGAAEIPADYLVNINGKYYTTYTTYAQKNWSGSAIPKVFGSFSPGFTYKNLSLSTLFTYAIGGKTYDNAYAALRSMSGTPSALHRDLLNAWDGVPVGMTETSANRVDPNGIPVVDFYRSDKNNAGTSTQFLKDGSYLVVKNVNLTYRFPQQLLNKLTVRSASLGVTIDNLYTATKLRGMNPQQSFAGTNDNLFVTPRVFSVVFNVGL
ncbi:TonB-linked SusC/RagA family outer membrane protein [Filimonas zeae]|nr:SusC/RagA family TonB-linked outer membrane protein [Filimonas zeae]MDR6339674.1 TonB-linked SusC/RagA family outer membrane protein [Filimonas zeae]